MKEKTHLGNRLLSVLLTFLMLLSLLPSAALAADTQQIALMAVTQDGFLKALSAVRAALPEGAELDGSTVKAEFTADSGRTLAVVLEIRADATYSVASWKATTLWTENGAGETLWSGAAQTR